MLTLFMVLVRGGQALDLFGHWLSASGIITCCNYYESTENTLYLGDFLNLLIYIIFDC